MVAVKRGGAEPSAHAHYDFRLVRVDHNTSLLKIHVVDNYKTKTWDQCSSWVFVPMEMNSYQCSQWIIDTYRYESEWGTLILSESWERLLVANEHHTVWAKRVGFCITSGGGWAWTAYLKGGGEFVSSNRHVHFAWGSVHQEGYSGGQLYLKGKRYLLFSNRHILFEPV